ncbi:uncharacterized protein LOC112561331 isoform X2 [Pomacea canaliculata]|uniref:uncharacterized protein LOC112561331 isoform X2 n=1 Tax=Pomacea canaliculata TaxID=400727 RepID=UPI000D73B2B0|nr:uncharacterized protein LOC112561331 isoform X2 [Pomacea canaliculata]
MVYACTDRSPTAMASAYLGPESPPPLAVISESYRHHYKLPVLGSLDCYNLGVQYEDRLFSLLHKYLELNTTDQLCYVGSSKDCMADRIREKFCLLEPVQTLLPGHFHYAETFNNKLVPIQISHVGAEEYFHELAQAKMSNGKKKESVLDKVLLYDSCRYLTNPAVLYTNIASCLAPGGILLIVLRPAHLSTLPFSKSAHQRLVETDIPYMETVRNLQSVGLDVEWDLECLPVCIPKRKWLAMLHEKYPPQMEIISQEEILAGLRELTEGILKYEGDEIEFTDRLLFIKATQSVLENSSPSIQRYTSGQSAPAPLQKDLTLTMKVSVDTKLKSSTKLQFP